VIRVFKTDLIRQQLTAEELSCLEDDFRYYKANRQLPDLFGRDVPYNHPNTLPSVKVEDIWHIHLLSGEASWPAHCKKQEDKTSDHHLVYCPAYHTANCFLLIAILSPDAHAQARRNNVMFNLASLAEKFRMQF
jgi:mRNA interferase YafO